MFKPIAAVSALVTVPAVVLAVALGGGITEGTVYMKEHQPYREYTALMPITSMSCSGNPSVCTTTITGWIPYTVQDDEDWVLYLRNEEGDTGTVNVSRGQFSETEEGDYWSKDGLVDKDRQFPKK